MKISKFLMSTIVLLYLISVYAAEKTIEIVYHLQSPFNEVNAEFIYLIQKICTQNITSNDIELTCETFNANAVMKKNVDHKKFDPNANYVSIGLILQNVQPDEEYGLYRNLLGTIVKIGNLQILEDGKVLFKGEPSCELVELNLYDWTPPLSGESCCNFKGFKKIYIY